MDTPARPAWLPAGTQGTGAGRGAHGAAGLRTDSSAGAGRDGGGSGAGAGARTHSWPSSEPALQGTCPALIWCPHTPNRLDYPQKHLQMMFLEPLSIRSGSEQGCSLPTPPRAGPKVAGATTGLGGLESWGWGAELPRGPPHRHPTARGQGQPGKVPKPRGPGFPWGRCELCLLGSRLLSLGLGPWGQGAFRPPPSPRCLPGV